MHFSKVKSEPDYQPKIDLAYKVLTRISNHSWEYGTLGELILEREHDGELSVFARGASLPPSTKPKSKLWHPQPLFDLVDPILARRAPNAKTIIEADGAAGDPASLGVALHVLADSVKRANAVPKYDYRAISDEQYDYLVNKVPKDKDGAISQRETEVQYWSDFVYMVPPFLAWTGAISSDFSILENSYRQCLLYRKRLIDPNGSGTWRHILGGSWNETGLWSTGNGWAAMGMMRVRQTMEAVSDPDLKHKLSGMKADLEKWMCEIIAGAFKFQSATSKLLPNYYDKKPTDTFDEVSGTALIAATAYRLVTLNPEHTQNLPMAQIDQSRKKILQEHIDPKTGGVSPVVPPLEWLAKKPFDGTEGKQSPEGQAFVIFLHLAWKNSVSSTASRRRVRL
ncbi:hypothetical protein CROQUDRAFT_724086 [Cronartium quercuum f. sp. fusiforme G11]|uniref:Uncharacterized protein n=1 Tax=Cronartium quercuum f. sp. fusiforme G11 TaxID=708437 RepID=A0A9P6NIQ6_9BASI|nr:hypothetical protein CROQUDRAFT_724086 [Cronartium quercuum f. sp. fusiforme G11]